MSATVEGAQEKQVWGETVATGAARRTACVAHVLQGGRNAPGDIAAVGAVTRGAERTAAEVRKREGQPRGGATRALSFTEASSVLRSCTEQQVCRASADDGTLKKAQPSACAAHEA